MCGRPVFPVSFTRSLRLLPLILLCAVCTVRAEGLEPGDLEAFERARRSVRKPGAEAIVNPAIEKLVDSLDVRSIRPLGIMLVESFGHQADLRKQIKKIRAEGAEARAETERLDSELAFLERKRKAGDKSVLPEIQRRVDERKRQGRRFDKAQADSTQLVRTAVYLVSVRERIADGLGRIVAAQKGAATQQGLKALREVCDIAQAGQALLLVRALRGASRPEAVPHLVEILEHPRASLAVRRSAVLTLARFESREAIGALVRASGFAGMERTVRHALGLAAGRHFATLVEAKAWAQQVGDGS